MSAWSVLPDTHNPSIVTEHGNTGRFVLIGMSRADSPVDDRQELAVRVVRCVNAHAALVEACEAAQSNCGTLAPDGAYYRLAPSTEDKLRTALALAKGDQT
jgi:hypothetical protein